MANGAGSSGASEEPNRSGAEALSIFACSDLLHGFPSSTVTLMSCGLISPSEGADMTISPTGF
ncbi:Uncharacterised protein [Mycobacteroides abscessus subsp. abscessus]|nr:Uncharacterised protein [Mycobacteroides abscessus subsp. abscessus]